VGKNIVLCCDGTGNEFGTQNSNVVKLFSVLNNAPGSQIAYYHPGVGTMGARNALTLPGKLWTKVRGLAFGYGISAHIADAYQFLMTTYEKDDRIFIFGFSRGAYTARALCGLLHMFGLLAPGNEALIPYALRLFKKSGNKKFRLAAQFKKIFSRECKPHFLGLWDTVSSVGWILDPIGMKPWRLPFTAKLPDIPVVRHAMSIDERRAFFRQNLITESVPGQDIKQVWFAGVHSDVGGSYPEPESGLSKLALRWMLCEARNAGLATDATRVAKVLGADPDYAPPRPDAMIHESLRWYWWPGEFWPKQAHERVPPAPGESKLRYRTAIRFNLGRHRYIAEGSVFHESVPQRQKLVPAYRPKNLPKTYAIEHDSCGEGVEGSGI
jgi:uncharacterized protein (DUF2235 family)